MALLLYILFSVTLVFQISSVSASTSFVPRLVGYAGDVTMEGGYDFVENKAGSSRSYYRTQRLRESLNLATAGYVYHPNLLSFKLEGSGYFDQERNSGSFDTSYTSSEASYGIDGIVFKKKPLNMQFYASQDRPFLVSSDRDDRIEEMSKSGIKFKYRKKGLLSTLKYDRKDEKRSRSETRTDDYDAYVSYYADKMAFLDKVNLSAWGLHQERQGSSDNEFNNINLTGKFGYSVFELRNSISYRENDSPTEVSELYTLSHNVLARLPWNFTSVLQYNLSSNDTERKDVNIGGVSSTTSDSERYMFSLTQKLFSSLVTTAQAELDKRESTSGDSEEKEYFIETLYTKKLPKNSQLQGGLKSETIWSEREGQLLIKDQIERVPAAKFFEIDADSDSLITLQVCKDVSAGCERIDSDKWINLQEDTHYVVVSGSFLSVRINMFDLAAFSDLKDQGLKTPTDNVYTLKVNYFLNDADYTIKSEQNDFFINLNLFGMVSGDYHHTLLRQDYDEDDYGFSDQINRHSKSTEDLLAIRTNYGPYGGRISYQTIKSNVDQDTFSLDLSYVKDELPTLFKVIRSGLTVDFSLKDISTEQDGISDKEKVTNASYEFWALATVPKVQVLVTLDSFYEYLRGDIEIVRLGGGIGGNRPVPLTGLEDRDVFSNSITFSRKFIEPRTKIMTSFWGKGTWERTTGSEDTLWKNYEYGVRANRNWVFGKTTFSLNARHKINKNTTNDYEAAIENSHTRTETKITLKVTRKLF